MYQPNNNFPQGVPVVAPPSRPRRGPGKWLILSVFLVIVGLSSVLVIHDKVRQGAFADPAARIQITNDGFKPDTATIKAGQTVRWTNTDNSPHELLTDPSRSKQPTVFSEKPLKQDESFTVKFDTPGTYPYYDPEQPAVFKATAICE